jgi:CRISPR-associated protein Cas5
MIKLNITDAEVDGWLSEPKDESEISIRALGTISLVTSSPGGYYQSQTLPSDFQVYGLMENALGWWGIPASKKVKSILNSHPSSSAGYQPLLSLFVELGELVEQPTVAFRFSDLWHQHIHDQRCAAQIEALSSVHSEVLEGYNDVLRRAEGRNDKGKFIYLEAKRFQGRFAHYYSTPTRREHVVWQGAYRRRFRAPGSLLETLRTRSLDPAALPYLGTSEGWVDLEIE